LANDKRVERRAVAAAGAGQGVTVTQEAKFHKGPLPSPEVLAGYEKIAPGFADRIVRMAEGEIEHRRGLEQQEFDANRAYMHHVCSSEKLGQWLAAGVAIVMPAIGAYVALHGEPTAGATIGVSGVATIVSALILGRSRKSLEQPSQSESKKD
jgi:uncharacterized membrane protein